MATRTENIFKTLTKGEITAKLYEMKWMKAVVEKD